MTSLPAPKARRLPGPRRHISDPALPVCTLTALEEPPDDRAVDDDPDRPVRRVSGAGDPSLLDQPEDLKLLRHTRAIALVDRLLRPLAEVDVPEGAVVGGHRGDTTEDVEWSPSLAQQRGLESLTLGVPSAGRSVDSHEDPLQRAERAVVVSSGDIAQGRSEGRA